MTGARPSGYTVVPIEACLVMPRAPKTAPATENSEAEASQPRLAEFEGAVAELESLVESLEAGDVPLEDALARFERGVALSRQCQSLLKNAELRVDQLMAASDDDAEPEPFDPPAED